MKHDPEPHLRPRRAKGFTLVEVIVVLVILAILAAIMIPAMTGWIDNANAKKCIDEMGKIARDYGACAAQSGYGKVSTLDVPACVKEAANDILGSDSGASGQTYTGSCGNTITLYLTPEQDAVRDAHCPAHGYLSGRGGGTGGITAGGSSPNSSLLGALTNATYADGVNRWTSGFDSTAASSLRTPTVLQYLTDQGVDLAALGVAAWSVRNANSNNGKSAQYFWTDTDITTAANNTKVRAVKYDAKTGLYSAGYIPVVTYKDTAVTPAYTYNKLGSMVSKDDYGFTADTAVAPSKDYDAVLAGFNALPDAP